MARLNREERGEMDPRDEQAERFDQVAAELELAAAHCRSTAKHFRDREIPRAGAHAFAAHGHWVAAGATFDEAAVAHADKAIPLPGV